MQSTYKSFTLTHLSPQFQTVDSQRVLKAIFDNNSDCKNTRGQQYWNTVKTLGKINAKAETSKYTFSSKEKNYPSAKTAGAT